MKCIDCRYYIEYENAEDGVDNECAISGKTNFFLEKDCFLVNDDGSVS